MRFPFPPPLLLIPAPHKHEESKTGPAGRSFGIEPLAHAAHHLGRLNERASERANERTNEGGSARISPLLSLSPSPAQTFVGAFTRVYEGSSSKRGGNTEGEGRAFRRSAPIPRAFHRDGAAAAYGERARQVCRERNGSGAKS